MYSLRLWRPATRGAFASTLAARIDEKTYLYLQVLTSLIFQVYDKFEKKATENLPGRSLIICFISSSNPISRIRSASSIIRHWRFLKTNPCVFYEMEERNVSTRIRPFYGKSFNCFVICFALHAETTV